MYKVLKRNETGKLVSPIQYTQGKMLKSYGKKRGDGTPLTWALSNGFDRTWNKQTGYWTFQCSLKNYDDTIEEWFKILPYFIEKIEHLEIYYEEDDYSKQYDIINGEVKLINDKFVYYG